MKFEGVDVPLEDDVPEALEVPEDAGAVLEAETVTPNPLVVGRPLPDDGGTVSVEDPLGNDALNVGLTWQTVDFELT